MRRRLTAFGLAVSVVLAGAGCSHPSTAVRALDGRIVSVADGDTITVRLASGASRKVRLLGVDSPETYATRYGTPGECGSRAASAFLDRFEGHRVRLIPDPGQAAVDRYGRLLRYVEVRSGEDLGAGALERGLVAPYVYGAPPARYARYRALAARARAGGRGSWGPGCGGDFHSSLPGLQDGLP